MKASEASATPHLEQIPVDALVPTPDNPRRVREDAPFLELVESIKGLGVIEPLIARRFPDAVSEALVAPEKAAKNARLYDLRAGHRRLAAAKKAGLSTVPVLVHDEMDDKRAIEITLAENVRRQDLTPIEEAVGYQRMIDHGWDIASIASRWKLSPGTIARRLQLNSLTEDWRSRLLDPNHDAGSFPTAVIERIARLPESKQVELAKISDDERESDLFRNIRDFNEHIARELQELKGVAWNIDDAILYPEAGACSACTKRSGANPLLWDDEAETEKKKLGDRCLDATCFQEKAIRFARAKLNKVRQEHEGAVALINGNLSSSEIAKFKGQFGKTVSFYEAQACKKTDKGAVPAVVVDGEHAGQTKWIKLPTEGASSSQIVRNTKESGKPTSLKERRAMLEGRRQAWVVNKVRERLEELADFGEQKEFKIASLVPKSDEFHQIAALLLCFGTIYHYERIDGFMHELKIGNKPLTDGWPGFELCMKADTHELIGHLYREIFPVMSQRLQYWQVQRVEPHYKEALRVCELLKIDAQELWSQACAEIPEPKGWANLNADGTPKSAAKKKRSEKADPGTPAKGGKAKKAKACA